VAPYLKHVRFPLMDMSDLASVVGPSKLLEESDLLACFSYVSVPSDDLRALLPKPNFKTEVRGGGGKRCKFSTVNDENGFFYFLGKEGGSSWTNPQLKGAISISMSSQSGTTLDHLCDRNPTTWSVRSNYGDSNPWIAITFSKYLLRPTEMVICQVSYCLRNWRLEGKERGKYDWQVIQEWKDDKTLQEKSPHYACFPIAKANKFYQSLRLYVTGQNTSGTMELDLTQLEFYGYYKPV